MKTTTKELLFFVVLFLICCFGLSWSITSLFKQYQEDMSYKNLCIVSIGEEEWTVRNAQCQLDKEIKQDCYEYVYETYCKGDE